MTYYNPYSEQTFFGVLVQLLVRLWEGVTGQLSWSQVANDEIQILTLVGIALSSALVGSFLVLRKMTMLANSLSHTMLLGIVVAYIWTHQGIFGEMTKHVSQEPMNMELMLAVSIVTGLITAFFTEFIHRVLKLQEDSSIGLVFTFFFALGITLVTLFTRNLHIGTEVVMGNVDGLQLNDCKLAYLIFALNSLLIVLFFKELTLTTFDPAFSLTLGLSPIFFSYLLMTQVSATATGAFRAVGVIMTLSFLTGPVLTARLLTHNLKKMILLSMGIGSAASVIGVALSRHLLTVYDMPLSTGGIVVCVITFLFVITLLFKQIHFSLPKKNY